MVKLYVVIHFVPLITIMSLFSVHFNVRVHHTSDTSVVIQPIEQTEVKPPLKIGQRQILSRHKPKGRCFQETTPKQAVSLVTCCSDRFSCLLLLFPLTAFLCLVLLFSVTAPHFLFWPTRRIAVAVWEIHGDKTSVISVPTYQVSYWIRSLWKSLFTLLHFLAALIHLHHLHLVREIDGGSLSQKNKHCQRFIPSTLWNYGPGLNNTGRL